MFYLVDAFTDESFRGNPAGVCLVDDYPDDFELQRFAKYYNWSEIAFLKRSGNDSFYIRWFSPLDEAPLCGHATLASAHVLFSKGFVSGNEIHFEYNGGVLEVEKSEEFITMNFPAKPVVKCTSFPFSVSKVIGLKSYKEVFKDDLVYVIVLNSWQDVVNAIPNFDEIKKVDCRAIAITAPGTDGFDFYSRYFAPRVGIYEDPVCGSMHCRLACYWSNVLKKNSFNAFQASSRTGSLKVELEGGRVKLSSKARIICELQTLDWPSRSRVGICDQLR